MTTVPSTTIRMGIDAKQLLNFYSQKLKLFCLYYDLASFEEKNQVVFMDISQIMKVLI